MYLIGIEPKTSQTPAAHGTIEPLGLISSSFFYFYIVSSTLPPPGPCRHRHPLASPQWRAAPSRLPSHLHVHRATSPPPSPCVSAFPTPTAPPPSLCAFAFPGPTSLPGPRPLAFAQSLHHPLAPLAFARACVRFAAPAVRRCTPVGPGQGFPARLPAPFASMDLALGIFCLIT
jgi:hypothetical protein